jgi:hypothetical protein
MIMIATRQTVRVCFSVVVLVLVLVALLAWFKARSPYSKTISSTELFALPPSAIGSDELTDWARTQKLNAHPEISMRIPFDSLPLELARFGNSNTMREMVFSKADPEAYVDVAFGGTFHRWGIIIGSTNLSSGNAPRGKSKLIKEGYLIYDVRQ